LTLAAAIAAGPADASLTVSASMPDATLQSGGEHELVVNLTLGEGWSVKDAGIPKAFLQIDTPPSVELKVVEEQRKEARREFVGVPFEQLIGPGTSRIGFKLTGTPGADETIGLNIIAYVKRDGDDEAYFVRRRLELPMQGGAEARPGDIRNSDWGGEEAGLQIGDKADGFSLPRADGTTVSLSDYRGRKHVLVTTYRAFW
jgi:hypothetical protein